MIIRDIAKDNKANIKHVETKELVVIHFLFHLLSDELLGMRSHFIRFVATDENWNFLLDHTGLGQNIIQIPVAQKQYRI